MSVISGFDKNGGGDFRVWGYNQEIDDEKILLLNGNGEPIIQSSIHYYCLQGEVYYGLDYKENLASGESEYYLIETGDKITHHFDVILNTDADKILIEYFDNPDVSSNDNDIIVRPFDYTSALDNTTTITSNPNVTAEGDISDINYVGGGTGVGDTTSGGQSVGGDFVYKLPANSFVLIKVTNKGSNAANYLFKQIWREVGGD